MQTNSGNTEQRHGNDIRLQGANGRNKRTVWSICPKPFPEAHFAVYPPELCETPLKAGCPEFVCKKCGTPKTKEIKITYKPTKRVPPPNKGRVVPRSDGNDLAAHVTNDGFIPNRERDITDKGYTSCSCKAGFEGGIVMDPFGGAGTTALVARKQNKRFILFEINSEYIKITNKRLKDFDKK